MASVTMSYQNSQMQIDVLRNELMKAGLTEDANRLNGIEISCSSTAATALEIVQKMKLMNGSTPKELRDIHNWTLQKLQAVAAQ